MTRKSLISPAFALAMDTIGKRVSFLSSGEFFSSFGWEPESWGKPFILLCLLNGGTQERADLFGREVAY